MSSRGARYDPRYGAGRQAVEVRDCFGCQRSLRRVPDRAVIWLCYPCHSAVSRAYEARLTEQGIEASSAPGAAWGPAWQALRAAIHGGDEALIGGLLAEGRQAQDVGIGRPVG